MKKSAILIVFIAGTLTFGQSPTQTIKMHKSAAAMKQELEKRIPLGSSLNAAQQLLQANGFTCSLKQQKSFIELTEDKSVIEHSNLDFLQCDKRDSLLTNTRFWQVAGVHQNGVISNLLTTVDTSPVLQKKDYVKMSDADIRSVLLKYMPLGSSSKEVARLLRDVFHRSCDKDGYDEKPPCPECAQAKGGFVFESILQHYNRRILEVNYVWAGWYFDKNGVLKELRVRHEWDGV
jgi:hypothetical protein